MVDVVEEGIDMKAIPFVSKWTISEEPTLLQLKFTLSSLVSLIPHKYCSCVNCLQAKLRVSESVSQKTQSVTDPEMRSDLLKFTLQVNDRVRLGLR